MSDDFTEEPEVNLRDPWLAAVLAFLVPGLGHLYQGRRFKAAVYSVCIIGLWYAGMHIGQWKINQAPTNRPGIPRSRLFSFAAQGGVGLPALIAYYQAKRFNDGDGELVRSLPPGKEITAEFSGMLRKQVGNDDIQDEVTGTVRLASSQGRFGDLTIIGRFDGQTSTGQSVEEILGEGVILGPVLRASRERYVDAAVISDAAGRDHAVQVGRLEGTIPRGFWNWFQAPLEEQDEQELHRELGKFHELAVVFTWIAGLLNLLAIWDALEGPAYGYGLVEEENDDQSEPPEKEAASASLPADEQVRKAG